MDKSTIKYLVELTPDKRLIAGMMVVISVLFSSLGLEMYNFSKYRYKKEEQVIKMQVDYDSKITDVYSKYLDLQFRRGDSLDAKIREADKTIEDVLKLLNRKK